MGMKPVNMGISCTWGWNLPKMVNWLTRFRNRPSQNGWPMVTYNCGHCDSRLSTSVGLWTGCAKAARIWKHPISSSRRPVQALPYDSHPKHVTTDWRAMSWGSICRGCLGIEPSPKRCFEVTSLLWSLMGQGDLLKSDNHHHFRWWMSCALGDLFWLKSKGAILAGSGLTDAWQWILEVGTMHGM